MIDPRAERRRRNRRRARRAIALGESSGLFERLEARLLLATDVWNGSVDGYWSTAGNWNNGTPSPGDDLDFPSGALNLTTTDDFADGTHFGNITIDASGYDLKGTNTIALDGTISSTYGSGTSTIDFPISLAATRTFDVAAGGVLFFNTPFSGVGGIDKTDGGTLTLGGSMAANSETGTTTVSDGTLSLFKAPGTDAIGGDLVIDGTSNSAEVESTSPDQIPDTVSVSLSGTGAEFDLDSNSAEIDGLDLDGGTVQVGTGTLDVGAAGITSTDVNGEASTIDVSSGGSIQSSGNVLNISVAGTTASDDLTIDGPIGSATGLTKTGAGILELTGSVNNAYTGTTTVDAGTLLIEDTDGGVSIPGNLVIGDDSTNPAEVQQVGSDQLADGDDVNVHTDGTYDLGTSTETIQTLTLEGGTVNIDAGGALDIAGSITSEVPAVDQTALIQGAGALDLEGNDTFPISVARDSNLSVDLQIGAVVQDGGIVKSGSGVLALSGANTFAGPVDVAAGTLQVESDDALGTTDGGTTVASGATLALAGGVSISENVAVSGSGYASGNGAIRNVSGSNTLSGTVSLDAASAIGVSAGALTISGVIGGGSFTLTKLGAGVLDLTADNTYTGTTTVDGGTLLIDGSVADNVSVSSGTLGGNGTINGLDTTISGSHLNPGPVGGTGTLSITPQVGVNLSFDSSSTFDVDIDGTSAYDSVLFPNMYGGYVTVSPGDATLAVHLGYSPSVGDSFAIVTTSGVGGSIYVNGTFNGLDDGATFDATYGNTDATFQISYNSDSITLTVTRVITTYTWNGLGGDDNWSTGANWVGGTAPTPGPGVSLVFPAGAAQMTNNDDLGDGSEFDNIAVNASGYNLGGDSIDLDGDLTAGFAQGTSTISDDIALQSTRTVTVPTGGTLTLSGAISGTGCGLTMTGGGTLEFAGASANTYTGTTTVNDGTLLLAKSDGVISANGSVIVGDGTTAATLQLGGSDQFGVGANVTVNEGSTFDVGASTAHISNLDLQGSTVQVDTNGVLATFVGINTTVPTNDVTSTIEGQGALQIDNTTNTFTIASDPNLTVDLSISAVIQGLDPTSGFSKEGAGTLALSGDNTFGGDTGIDSGTVIVESDTALGSDSGTVTVQSGASLWLEGDTLSIANPLDIAGDGVDIRGALRNFATAATVSGDVTLAGASRAGSADGTVLDFTGTIDSQGENYLLTVDNDPTGTVILDADNTTDGDINVVGGILEATHDDSFGDPTNANVVTITNTGATIELSGGISTPATKSLVIQGGGANSGADDNLINASGDNTFGGPIQLQANSSVSVATGTTLSLPGDISQSGPPYSLSKDGAGTLVLSGTGSYTGDTTINDGTMQVDGDISASDVAYVNPGATLDGTGTAPAPSVGGGGTIAPGDGGPGILNTGVLGMSPGSIATFFIDGPTAGSGYSQVVVSGTSSVVIDEATLSLDLGYTPAIGTQFTLIGNDTGQILIGAFDGLVNNQTFTQGNITFQISYAGGADHNSVVLTVTDVVYTWSGDDATSGDWTLGDNWVGGRAPRPGARLVFPAEAPRTSNLDNFVDGFSVYEIDFQAAGYAITGNAIDLSNGIFTTYTTGSVDFELDAELEQSTVTVALDGGTLSLEGAITQPLYQYRTLDATGSGTLTLGGTGNNAFARLQADGPSVVLDKTSGYAIWAEGDFDAGSTLTLGADGQLDDGITTLKLYEETTFNLAGYSTSVDSLELEGATVLVPTGSTLTLTSALNGDLSTDSTTSQIVGGGTIDLNGSDLGIDVAEDAGAGVTLQIGTVMTDGGITKDGAGTLALGAANTFGGDVQVNAGTLIVQDASALGSGVGATAVENGATLELDSAGSIAEPITLGMCGSGATLVNASGDNDLTGSVTLVGDSTMEVDAGSLTIDGQVSGTGGFTVAGTGELTLTASNTYSGATMISAGTLDITNSGALSTSAVTIDNGATLQLDGGITITPSSITVAGAGAAAAGALIAATGDNAYAGPITLAAALTDIDVEAGATLDLSGAIGEDVLGRQLVSIGGGTLVLGGTGSYTSGASLQAGTTVVDGSIAASPSGVSVQYGATLAGTGTVNPDLSVFSGATVAPGDVGTTGILNTGNAGFVTGSTFHARLDGTTAGTGYDQLDVTGGVDLDGATLSLSIGDDFQAASGDTFTIIDNVTAGAVGGTFDGLPEGAIFAADGQAFQISYIGGDGNDVTLTAVPIAVTPTTLVAPAVGSAYSDQLAASGGSGMGYTYTATGLPPGLSISASGLITGTPTDDSHSPYTVQVTITDGDGATATVPLTIAVDDALSITPSPLPSAAVGTAYSQPLAGSGGSGSGYTYSATGLPTGLSISAGGLISGTLSTVAGSPFGVVVTITDGDGNTRDIPLSLAGVAGASTTTLASSADLAIVGQAFTLTATVSASEAGSVLPGAGTVTFLDGTTVLGTAPVVGGTAQLVIPTLTAGPHSLTASFSGSDDFLSSTSQALDLPSLYPATSTFLVTGTGSSVSPPITFTLAVASQGGQVATGQVQFLEDGVPIGTAALDDGGTATFTTAAIAAGPHTFAAVYAGDAMFAGSTSSRTATIGPAQAQVGDVASSAPQVFYGQQVTLTVTFTAPYNGQDVMTGTVSFYDGGTFLGTAVLSSLPPGNSPTSRVSPAASPAAADLTTQVTGQATLPDVTLTVGDHVIQAVYSGDSDYAGATSTTPVSVGVQPATTGTQLNLGTDATGATILTATIVPTSPGTPTLTGTVTFYDGDTLLGTATVVNQVATFDAGVLGAGTHSFRAVFSGGAEAVSSGSTTVVYTPPANGPVLVKVRRYGRHFQPTYLVLSFSGALDPSRAEDVENYQLVKLNRRGQAMGRPITIKVAAFDPAANTVTLAFAHPLSRFRRFRLTVFGSSSGGITAMSGQPLNATPGQPSGGNFEGIVTRRDFAGSSRGVPIIAERTSTARS